MQLNDSEPAEASFYQRTDSFTVAGPRKKRKPKVLQERPSPRVLLDRVTDELVSGSWFTHCQQLLRDSLNQISFTALSILCLGLGSPTSSRDARAQLAFLVQLCDTLNIKRQDVFIYDPVFTGEDVILLCDLQFQTLIENNNAAYSIKIPTLVFMPHCDITLYENILRQNWSFDNLRNMIFIANHFQEYFDRWDPFLLVTNTGFKDVSITVTCSIPKRRLSAEFPCLQRFVPIIHSKPLPLSASFETAFNNISYQFVYASALPSVVDEGFWAFPPVPRNK